MAGGDVAFRILIPYQSFSSPVLGKNVPFSSWTEQTFSAVKRRDAHRGGESVVIDIPTGKTSLNK